MTFCPRCGASLKMETSPQRPAPPPTNYRTAEKSEKGEKHEKNQQQGEKGEKHEKGEFGYIGWLIGGVFIIILGLLAFANATGYLIGPMQGAITLLIVGVAVIIVAIWISSRARRRNPTPAPSVA